MKIADAIELEQTAFPDTIRFATDVKHCLKRASNNTKLGKASVFRKGPFKGMPLYSLTLEERATCDSRCPLYEKCYGNHMPFAHRFVSGPSLERKLEHELAELNVKYPNGFVVRLHVLGDFYSVAYVYFWNRMLGTYRTLHVYGYTHTQGAIKHAIDITYMMFIKRFVIYQSDAEEWETFRPRANANDSSLPLCPQQQGKVKSCVDCGLCTNATIRGVSWRTH